MLVASLKKARNSCGHALKMRLIHMSYETEKSYIWWVKNYIKFYPGKYPRELGVYEISEFLSYPAEKRSVRS